MSGRGGKWGGRRWSGRWNESGSGVCVYELVIALTQDKTRQSDMANTSPRHMPVLGNVHPIKIENLDIFS